MFDQKPRRDVIAESTWGFGQLLLFRILLNICLLAVNYITNVRLEILLPCVVPVKKL